MKRISLSLFTAALLFCTAGTVSAQQKGNRQFGKAFNTERVMQINGLTQEMATKKSVEDVSVSGQILEVCQAEGCWLKLKNMDSEEVFVKLKDHAFVVPKDIAGKYAIVHGTAMKKVVSVEERKHLASDAGATKEVIAAIDQPKEEYRIEATGVVVIDK